jgi:hypothetical protein
VISPETCFSFESPYRMHAKGESGPPPTYPFDRPSDAKLPESRDSAGNPPFAGLKGINTA